MKIVELITDLYSRAGAQVFLLSLYQEMKRKYVNDEIYLISIWKKTHSSFSDLLDDEQFHFFSCDKTSSKSFIKPSNKLRRILKEINPDIVHTHRNVFPTYFLSFGFKRQHWKICHTFHNVAENESTFLGRLLIKKYLKRRLITPIGISDEITKSVSLYYKTSLNDVRTIYNGIKIDEIDYNATTKIYDIICVARFDTQKNHMFLLKTLKKYIFDGDNSSKKIKLALLGDGVHRAECEKYVNENGMVNNVIFLGEKSNPYNYLLKSKLFILPSIYEGNPISILEAMSVGLPILASRVGGIPDVVKDGINGYLFNVNDSDDLISSLNKLMRDDSNRDIIAKNNISISKQYSIGNCSKEYHSLFSEVCKK